jgi:surface protein
MFYDSKFDQDISDWDVSNVENMKSMFEQSKFNQDISKWVINKNCKTESMFVNCSIEDKYRPFQNGERL